MDGSPALRFGHFELQAQHRRLLRDGEPLTVGARAFDVLLSLAERRERIVTKAELMDLVWPGLVVEENNLQVQISSLRKLLGSGAIATIPGRGYRFTAAVAGHDEAPSIKQRLAAIMAADVAGYSRLMADNENATVIALDAARAVFRARIESTRGRVIDMAGDSVLAVFETATRAVSTALAIQDELRRVVADLPEQQRMLFRIGVHLGDVIEKADGTAYGDGVNIAARLQSIADGGGVVASESIRVAVKNKVAVRFDDLGERRLKNIPDPIRCYRIFPDQVQRQTTAPRGEIDLSLPDRPSVAVLAFANMSADPEQEFFTDGVCEAVVTELARFHELFVIAHSSSFSYKGTTVDIKTIARELGVRYVVQGSIRKGPDRIRVTAQLIDATTGVQVWAEKYDRALDDVFEVQDKLTEDIVRQLAPQVLEVEAQRVLRRHPDNLRGYEVALRAYSKTRQAHVNGDVELLEAGIAEARTALSVDPRSATGLAAVAFGHWQLVYLRSDADTQRVWMEGIEAADRLIELDRNDSQGYMYKGLLQANAVLLARGSGHDLIDEALENLRRAYDLNPHNSTNLISLCYGENMAGNVAKSIEYAKEALRLSPRDPLRFSVYHNLSSASFSLGDYQIGTEYALRGLGDAPGFLLLHIDFLRCQVGLGNFAVARSAFDEAKARWPKYFESPWTRAVQRNPWYRKKSNIAIQVAAGLAEPRAFEAFCSLPAGSS